MTSDPIINQVDEEFSLQLTKLLKNYILDLVNHEVDVLLTPIGLIKNYVMQFKTLLILLNY